MSAVARAEARRRAILSRGSDRLAKLTTSARGEDAPAYLHDGMCHISFCTTKTIVIYCHPDPPLPHLSTGLKSFVGEESSMPPPRKSISPSPTPTPTPRPTRMVSAPAATSRTSSQDTVAPPPVGQRFETTPDPSVWSLEQQRAFMQAIMSGTALPQQSPESLPGLSPIGGEEIDPSLPPMDNPFAAMLFPQRQGQGMSTGNGAGKGMATDVAPPTKLQRLMPLVHLSMMWCMLAYFVMWDEPKVYKERQFGEEFGVWRRWTELRTKGPIGTASHMLQIQVVVGTSFHGTHGDTLMILKAILLGFHDLANRAAFPADIFWFCAWPVNRFLLLLNF